jgi:type IX secretion system PorP/SprF family membrane protein
MQTITSGVMSCLRIIVAGVALTFVTEVKAQYDVLFSHYYDMETSFNPAAAGKNPKLNITAAYAMDLAGFEHNPQTAYVSADMPFLFLGGTHGAGAQFMSDKLGLFDHMRISLQYANKQRLFGGELSIGVQASLLSEKFDGSGLDLEDSSDPAFTSSEVNGNGFDLGAGIYYKRKQFYVGVSALHLTSPKVELGEVNELQIDPTY